MISAAITVYGAYWCPDCRRAKKFLGEQLIPYNWVDIEQDKSGEEFVLANNHGRRIIPTIVFADGSILAEPNNAELAHKLGLKTEARLDYYDLIIVGGGPTGLTASIYTAREGIETLLVERSGLGGQAGITVGIENFPGFPEGITGQDFAERVTRQARRFGVEILQAQEVAHLTRDEGYQCVQSPEGKHYHARSVLLATGAAYRRLGVPGEEDFIGAGVHFCATCDGPFYAGAKEIIVVGGGNTACEEGLHLSKFTERITLLVRGEQLTASQILIDKVTGTRSPFSIHYSTEVEAFEGEGAKLKAVRIKNTKTGERDVLHPAAAFIFIGQQPNSEFLRGYLDLDPYGYILTGHDLVHGPARVGRGREQDQGLAGNEPFAFETSIPGVFAAGDVRHGSTKQIASAVGEGAAAAIAVREFLKKG